MIAPHGVLAYHAALSADLADRKASGADVLRANDITISPSARTKLMAGQVDSRLVLAIASLAADHPIDIVQFGNIGPGGDPDIPLRFADLAENDQAAHLASSAYVQALRASLNKLGPSLRPARTQVVVLQTGQSVFRFEYTAPSPLGLFSG